MEFLVTILSIHVMVAFVLTPYFWAKKTNRSQAPIVRRFTGFAYGLIWPVLVVRFFAERRKAKQERAERAAAERRILGDSQP